MCYTLACSNIWGEQITNTKLWILPSREFCFKDTPAQITGKKTVMTTQTEVCAWKHPIVMTEK